MIWAILSSAIIILFSSHILRQLFFKRQNAPPEVFSFFPWIGSMVTYGIEPYNFWKVNQKKYGDIFTFIMGGRYMTVCLGTEGNDMILNGKLSQVSAEAAYTNLTTPVFGEGVAYDSPNPEFMQQKKFIKFGLTPETFRVYVPLMITEFESYIKTSHAFSTNILDLREGMSQLILFTASRTLQGKVVRDALSEEYASTMEDLDRCFTPLNFLFPKLPLPSYKKRDIAQKKLANLYISIIQDRRKAQENGEQTENDMINNLMGRTYKSGQDLTDRDVAHIMIALLMAGQHTSSTTSAWALLHLATKPEIVEQMLEEQRKVCGDRPLEYEDLAKMTLLNNVIKETLRLHPPLHSLMRKVISLLVLGKSGYVVPEGHYVMAAPGLAAMSEQYFEHPQEFIPNRWTNQLNDLNDEKEDFGFGIVSKGTASPYLPFGAGRHRCVGEQFAYVQLGTIITQFVKTFEFKLANGRKNIPEVDYTSMVTLPQNPATIEYKYRHGN